MAGEGERLVSHTRFRRCELVVNVSAVMEGTIDMWPANIQDKIYEALERRSHVSRVNFKITKSYCVQDVPEEPPYVYVEAVALETLQ